MVWYFSFTVHIHGFTIIYGHFYRNLSTSVEIVAAENGVGLTGSNPGLGIENYAMEFRLIIITTRVTENFWV